MRALKFITDHMTFKLPNENPRRHQKTDLKVAYLWPFGFFFTAASTAQNSPELNICFIDSFIQWSVVLYLGLDDFCLIWDICAGFWKEIGNCSLLIPSLTLGKGIGFWSWQPRTRNRHFYYWQKVEAIAPTAHWEMWLLFIPTYKDVLKSFIKR